MRKEAYRDWLQGKLSKLAVSDSISRCGRIEECLELNLDDEYQKDGGRSLVELLEYSRDDERLNRPAPSGIVFAPGSDIRSSMSSLRSAVKKYFQFCRSHE
jgi:hypothetical protein